MKKLTRKGDTIVEVMLALTILSAVLFTAWGVTTRAIQQSLAARQRIEMVNQMKEQAEIIKSVYAAQNGAGSAFKSALGISGTGAPVTNLPCDGMNFQTPTAAGRFYLTANSSSVAPVAGLKAVSGKNSQRVWVQYNEVDPAVGTGYIDFYVRGCWETTGGNQRTDLSEFVVRLNV